MCVLSMEMPDYSLESLPKNSRGETRETTKHIHAAVKVIMHHHNSILPGVNSDLCTWPLANSSQA